MEKSLKSCSSCKKPFNAKDIRNNLCEKCLAAEVVKHWLKSDKITGVQTMSVGRITRQKFNDTVDIFVKDTFYYEGDLHYFFQDPNAAIVAEYTEKDRQFFEAERKAEKSG